MNQTTLHVGMSFNTYTNQTILIHTYDPSFVKVTSRLVALPLRRSSTLLGFLIANKCYGPQFRLLVTVLPPCPLDHSYALQPSNGQPPSLLALPCNRMVILLHCSYSHTCLSLVPSYSGNYSQCKCPLVDQNGTASGIRISSIG